MYTKVKSIIYITRVIQHLSGNQISQLNACHYHSFAVSTDGKLWGWGENVDYVLGPSCEEEDRGKKSTTKKVARGSIYYKPIELKVNKNLVRITGGVTNLFEEYFSNAGNKLSKTISSGIGKIQKIACGGSHTLAITTNFEVLCWGYGDEVYNIY